MISADPRSPSSGAWREVPQMAGDSFTAMSTKSGSAVEWHDFRTNPIALTGAAVFIRKALEFCLNRSSGRGDANVARASDYVPGRLVITR